MQISNGQTAAIVGVAFLVLGVAASIGNHQQEKAHIASLRNSYEKCRYELLRSTTCAYIIGRWKDTLRDNPQLRPPRYTPDATVTPGYNPLNPP